MSTDTQESNSTEQPCLRALMLLLCRHAAMVGAAVIVCHDNIAAAYEDLCNKGLGAEARTIVAAHGCKLESESVKLAQSERQGCAQQNAPMFDALSTF